MTVKRPPLKAPFPWPGGKSRVADMVWDRLGNCDNYVEPFAGSLAVLLRRPAEHFEGRYRVETVNDLNHYIVNLWRAIKADPEKVAEYADHPVAECDLHARHKWLVRSREAAEWRDRMVADPDHYDAKVAGWWVWGQCCWIGSGWCDEGGEPAAQIVDLSGGFGNGCGVVGSKKLPELASGAGRGDAAGGPTDWQQVPKASSSDGVNAFGGPTDWQQPPEVDGRGRHGRPQLADAFDIGRGVNGSGALSTQVPRLGSHALPATGVAKFFGPPDGTCSARREWLVDWMQRLSDRLRLVRTCYGHWSRICDSESTLTRLGTTGVFLDPPYPAKSVDGKKSRDANLYATDKGTDLDALRDEVLAWCRKWGDDPNIRVAVCCYDGDGYEPLVTAGWECVHWEASGGYGNQKKKSAGKAENAKRERIYFSPACISPARSATLFDLFS